MTSKLARDKLASFARGRTRSALNKRSAGPRFDGSVLSLENKKRRLRRGAVAALLEHSGRALSYVFRCATRVSSAPRARRSCVSLASGQGPSSVLHRGRAPAFAAWIRPCDGAKRRGKELLSIHDRNVKRSIEKTIWAPDVALRQALGGGLILVTTGARGLCVAALHQQYKLRARWATNRSQSTRAWLARVDSLRTARTRVRS